MNGCQRRMVLFEPVFLHVQPLNIENNYQMIKIETRSVWEALVPLVVIINEEEIHSNVWNCIAADLNQPNYYGIIIIIIINEHWRLEMRKKMIHNGHWNGS